MEGMLKANFVVIGREPEVFKAKTEVKLNTKIWFRIKKTNELYNIDIICDFSFFGFFLVEINQYNKLK